ncbi:MAG: carboxypeptidase-like regulatory domain-containing protein, partial [Candidatus Micrarchaeota archaeon]|nr:carboxypeptidase-like regulatory domain-containing protein [Candidatus Micrarchaeota archaeon]
MPLPGFLEEIRERMESRGIPFIALPIAVIAVIAGVAAYFLFFAAPTSTAFKLTVLSSGDAVGGAVVEVYDDAGNLLDSVVTDEAGLASFTRLPAQRVKFTISKTGFEQYERLLDLHRLVSAKVDLAVPEGPTPTAAAPTPSVAPLVVPPAPADKKSEAEFEAREVPKYGELVVQVRDEEGNTLDALVFVHDADTGTQLDSKKASKGTASFSGIQVGTKVAVSARLTGYLSYPDSKGEDNKFFIRDQPTASDVVLKKTTAEDSGETQILVADDSLKPVSGASVSVYIVGELAPVDENKTDARGKYALNLSAGVSYYAMALKKGLLPNFSIAFGAGENVSITLSKPTANNSASLAVNSTDEYMKPLQSTAVVFTEFGERLAEPKETGPGGVAVFDNLPRDWTVVARASAGNKYGSEKVVLDNATRQANIVLDVHYANLTLQALDAMTEKPVGVPKFTVFWRNALIAECAGQNCTATVKSDTELAVEARATGYFTTNWTVEAAAGNTTRATITMIPSGTDKDSFVNLKKIYEKGSPSLIVYERGTIPTTDFLRGHTYIADLEFFAKAGADEGWMVARTSGWITWHSPNTPLFKGDASAAGTACAG